MVPGCLCELAAGGGTTAVRRAGVALSSSSSLLLAASVGAGARIAGFGFSARLCFARRRTKGTLNHRWRRTACWLTSLAWPGLARPDWLAGFSHDGIGGGASIRHWRERAKLGLSSQQQHRHHQRRRRRRRHRRTLASAGGQPSTTHTHKFGVQANESNERTQLNERIFCSEPTFLHASNSRIQKENFRKQKYSPIHCVSSHWHAHRISSNHSIIIIILIITHSSSDIIKTNIMILNVTHSLLIIYITNIYNIPIMIKI